MTISRFGKPFCVNKKIHPFTLKTLIGVRSKLESFGRYRKRRPRSKERTK
jgi:hypothetical protein